MSRKRQVQTLSSEFIDPQARQLAPGEEERPSSEPLILNREEGVAPESESSESFPGNPTNPKRRNRRNREEALLGELKAARDQLQGVTDALLRANQPIVDAANRETWRPRRSQRL